MYYATEMTWEEKLLESEEEDALLTQLYASNKVIITHLLEGDEEPACRGSIFGHLVINCRREDNYRLWNDYFSENPMYRENIFRRRFRMRRSFFLRIVETAKEHDTFFVQKRDGLGKLGLTTLHKVTSAFCHGQLWIVSTNI